MSALGTFTLRSLRANRVRTLVTVAGVALAAALLTAVLTSYTSLTGYLYRSEVNMAGSWMAYALLEPGDASRDEAGAVTDAPGVAGEAVLTDVGFGQLTKDQQNWAGTYLPILSMAGDVGDLCAVRASEGRLPERAGEILLPLQWQEREGVQVGDELTVEVGQRVVVPAEGAASGQDAEASAPSDSLGSILGEGSDEGAEGDFGPGTVLDSSMGLLTGVGDDRYGEELVDIHPRSYTVVGFYDRMLYSLSMSTGLAALTADDPEAEGLMAAYVTLDGMGSQAQVRERMGELFPGAPTVLHTGLLRFMGVRGAGAIWDTFFGIVAVLAIVIVVACVSLIYNAFNISVAERMRQFGLLASIGASRRQLRRTVLAEAALVAGAGIPLGIVVGLAGCVATFALLGPSLQAVLGNADVPFLVEPRLWAIAFAVVLTLVTVLVSAFVPARRAARVCAVEALRQTGPSRVTRRGVADAARRVAPDRLWRPRGVLARVFGVGGTIGALNDRRGTGKGRAASVSLALAVVLLMTAGSLNVFLGALTTGVGQGPSYDIGVSVMPRESHPDPGAEGLASPAEDAERYRALFADLCAVSGVEPVGWSLNDSFRPLIVPQDMAGKALRTSAFSGSGVLADDDPLVARVGGGCVTMALVAYLDDDDFDAYARRYGVDPALFADPAVPRALAVSTAYGNDGTTYQLQELFGRTGTVQLILGGRAGEEEVRGFSQSFEQKEGVYEMSLVPYVFGDDDTMQELDWDDVELEVLDVEVVGLTAEPPASMGRWSSEALLVMPLSTMAAGTVPSDEPTFSGAFDAPAGDHAAVTGELADVAGAWVDAQGDQVFEGGYSSYVNDHAANVESTQMLVTVVNVFCLLFTVILALIALANVFNTVANGLILRRREFAVMRSVGLSNRQFRRMIVSECVRYGLRGLVPGLVVSALVSYALWRMVSLSLSGLDFTLPWAYVALAVGMTVLAMAASVAYGLRRCRADNVVEALRTDAA